MKYSGSAMIAITMCSYMMFANISVASSPRIVKETAQQKRGDSATKHRLILQVNSNDPAMMNLALNNAANVAKYYEEIGESVEVEIVTFGPGLHMLRDDTSPVKDRIKSLATGVPSISFKACGNTQDNMSKAENKPISLIPEAALVRSGVVRVMELQERGWSYVKP